MSNSTKFINNFVYHVWGVGDLWSIDLSLRKTCTFVIIEATPYLTLSVSVDPSFTLGKCDLLLLKIGIFL